MLGRMLRSRSARRRGERGFTLVELMVVVGVLAILALFGISQYRGARATATDGGAMDYIDQFRRTLALYYAANAKYPSDATTLKEGVDNSGGAVYTALATAVASMNTFPTTLATSPLGSTATFHYTPNTGSSSYTLWTQPASGTGNVMCADVNKAVSLASSSGITNGTSCQ